MRVVGTPGSIIQSAWIGGICAFLLVVTFSWAVAVGGQSISDRFSSIADGSISQTFQQNRGIFITYTFEELLLQYPFGAGVGRWGMMNVYFGGDPGQAPQSGWKSR